MRRKRMMLAAAVVALSASAAGAGVASAQTGEGDPELAAQCASYNIIEWLLFHHECHGHTPPYIVYWPS